MYYMTMYIYIYIIYINISSVLALSIHGSINSQKNFFRGGSVGENNLGGNSCRLWMRTSFEQCGLPC